VSQLGDFDIRTLFLTDPTAWARAVDPTYDEFCRLRERAAAPELIVQAHTPAAAAHRPAPAAPVSRDDQPITYRTLKRVVSMMADALRESRKPLEQRVAALEAKLEELERGKGCA